MRGKAIAGCRAACNAAGATANYMECDALVDNHEVAFYLFVELARRIGDDVQAHIGTPVRSSELSFGNDRQELLDHLRGMVYGLDPMSRPAALAS